MFGDNLLPEASAELIARLTLRSAAEQRYEKCVSFFKLKESGGKEGKGRGEQLYLPTATVINSLMLEL